MATGKQAKGFKEKACKFCGELFTPLAPSHLYCSQDCADNGWSEKYLKRTYGIDFDEWVCMFEKAEGKCALCGSNGFKLNPKSFLTLVVDHDHNTGKIRGMLCHNCNRALGLLHDDTNVLQKAIDYLGSATTIREE